MDRRNGISETQTLNNGAYRKVCKAKCDNMFLQLKFFTKLFLIPLHSDKLHQTDRTDYHFDDSSKSVSSVVKHPNIVQILGTHQDSETSLPILLMEFIDESLNIFWRAHSIQSLLLFTSHAHASHVDQHVWMNFIDKKKETTHEYNDGIHIPTHPNVNTKV